MILARDSLWVQPYPCDGIQFVLPNHAPLMEKNDVDHLEVFEMSCVLKDVSPVFSTFNMDISKEDTRVNEIELGKCKDKLFKKSFLKKKKKKRFSGRYWDCSMSTRMSIVMSW